VISLQSDCGTHQVRSVSTEVELAIGARYGIRSIPTLALFHYGRELARQPDTMGVAEIVLWVQAYT